jgi:hypothetical protein
MSKLDEWLEEHQWNLATVEVKELRESFAADIAEALKSAHNTTKVETVPPCLREQWGNCNHIKCYGKECHDYEPA